MKKLHEGLFRFSSSFKILIFLLLLMGFYIFISNILSDSGSLDQASSPLIISVIMFTVAFLFLTKGVEKVVNHKQDLKLYIDKSTTYTIKPIENISATTVAQNDINDIILYPNIYISIIAFMTGLGICTFILFLFPICGLQGICHYGDIFQSGMILQGVFIALVFLTLFAGLIYSTTQSLVLPGFRNIFLKKPTIILRAKGIELHSVFSRGLNISENIMWEDIEKIGKSYPYSHAGRYAGWSLNGSITIYLKKGGYVLIQPSMLPITKSKFFRLLGNYPVRLEQNIAMPMRVFVRWIFLFLVLIVLILTTYLNAK